jgi:hypothetical protein
VTLREGLLVEAKDKNGNLFLASVSGPCPKTKKNWACVAGDGTQRSIAPKAVTFVVPGSLSSFSPEASSQSGAGAALACSAAADQALANPDAAATLEVAWEVALEDVVEEAAAAAASGGGGGGCSLADLAGLLTDLVVEPSSPSSSSSTAPSALYATYALLERHPVGKCYFKQLPSSSSKGR